MKAEVAKGNVGIYVGVVCTKNRERRGRNWVVSEQK